MRPHDIVGYTFRADTYCPACIVGALPTGEGEPFDGWALATGIDMSPEDNLSEIAIAFGIDRDDERSFDSNDFPKVVFHDSAADYPHTHGGELERCGACGTALIESSDLDDGLPAESIARTIRKHFTPDV